MANTPLPDQVKELLAQPNPAVIATLRPDGQPVTVATWYLFENDRILVNMEDSRKRLEHMRADGRVSVTALKDGDWYTHVSVQGRIAEWVDDDDLTDIDRLSVHYTSNPYPNRENKRISAWIEIESWHGWGAAKQD
jgi:PPOX class probable F420-dependent enzyme